MDSILNWFNFSQIYCAAIIVLLFFPIHQYAHATTAKRLGDNTPELAGRLTLNPIPHLSLRGVIALVLLGIGWSKPMPMNSSNFKNPRKDLGKVAIAGPIVDIIIILLLCISTSVLSRYYDTLTLHTKVITVLDRVFVILFQLLSQMLWLFIMNLLPLPVFDGGNILFAILPLNISRTIMRFTTKHEGAVTVCLLLLWLSGVVQMGLSFLSILIYNGITWLISPILNLIF